MYMIIMTIAQHQHTHVDLHFASQHCVDHSDYSMAYELLEVGGLYYLVGDEGSDRRRGSYSKESTARGIAGRTGGIGGIGGSITFLSTQIKHHPLYQSAALWTSVLNNRVSCIDTRALEKYTDSASTPNPSAPSSPQREMRKRHNNDLGTTTSAGESDEDDNDNKKDNITSSIQSFQHEVRAH